ncbi:MAG: hypothetical protein QG670_1861 [Thermoproteota archaeon]|nr:hypothetical protein [Thermoproteota archaeon]
MLNNKIQISVISSSKAKAIRDLHELIHLAEYCPKKVKMLLIKPNVCGMYPPDIKLLEKIVETFEPYAESIIIGETNSTMNSPEDRFRRLGITDLAKRHGVEARNLMKDSVVKKRVPQPHAMVEVPLPSTVLEADVLINVPGIGRHGTTLLTCAMKNLFGLIATSSKYASLHPLGVDRVIADVYQTAKPNLNVVDAGSQILVSTDTLGVDMVAAGIMRMDPLAVEHLVLASRDRGILLENLNINRIIL